MTVYASLLAICQGTGTLVVVAMMDGVRTVRDIVSVLAAFVGFGLGAGPLRLTMHRTLRFIIELIR